MKLSNLFIVIRILIGGFFIVSGGEKLLGHYQNFLYVVQQYEIFPGWLEDMVAYVVPWVELFLGVFIVLGLWLKPCLVFLGILIVGFILIIGQALIRDLPITECGCLGELVSFPPQVTIFIDAGLLLLVFMLVWQFKHTSKLSLDKYFEQSS